MTYKPSSVSSPPDLLAGVKALIKNRFQIRQARQDYTGALTVSDPYAWSSNSSGAKTLIRDALGPRHDYATTAAQSSSAYISTGIDNFTPRYGSGVAIKMAVTSVVDGRGGLWIDAGNSGNIFLAQSQGVGYSQHGAGICYDKALGHTTWQFFARETGAFVGVFVDSGVALADNAIVILMMDCPDMAHVTMTIMDVNGNVLATYTLPSSGNAALDPTVNYWVGAGIHTGVTGSPAVRSFQWWFLNDWTKI